MATIKQAINELLPAVAEKLRHGGYRSQIGGFGGARKAVLKIYGIKEKGFGKREAIDVFKRFLADKRTEFQSHEPAFSPVKTIYLTPQQRKAANDAFFESRKWMELRYKAILLHGRKCLCCGASGDGVVIQVDHVKPRSKYPELALELSNLQCLCRPCNLGKGAWDETDWRATA